MISLYEISDAYKQVQFMLEEDLDNEELKQALDNIDGDFEEKADNIAKVIRHLTATESALKEEEKRLADRRRTISNNIKNTKEYLKYNMEVLDKKKFDTDLFKFYIRNNKQTVKYEEGVILPEEYYITEEVKTINKELVESELKEGVWIEGAKLDRTQSLIIKW